MSPRTSFVSGCAVVLSFAAAGSVHAGSATTVYFGSGHQGNGSGNYGYFLRPFDDTGSSASLMMTARTSLTPFDKFNPFASGLGGTLYLSSSGAGVQDDQAGGSTAISGLNNDGIEEIKLTFDSAVRTDSLYLSIASYNPGDGHDDRDDPMVFVFLAGGDVVSFDEFNGIVFDGNSNGMLDLGSLLDPEVLVEGIAVRETRSHIRLESLRFMATVPAPGSLALLGLAGVLGARRRRKA